MSQTFSLLATKSKVSLWVGKTSSGKPSFYNNENFNSKLDHFTEAFLFEEPIELVWESDERLEDSISFEDWLAKNHNPDDFVRITPEQITVGREVYVWGDNRLFNKMKIVEVLRPDDEFKAFVSDDGCRYGISYTYIKKGTK